MQRYFSLFVAVFFFLKSGECFAQANFVESIKPGKVYELKQKPLVVELTQAVKNNTEAEDSPFSLRIPGRRVEQYDKFCKLDPGSQIRILQHVEDKGYFLAEIVLVGPMFPDFDFREKLCTKGVHSQRDDGQRVNISLKPKELEELFRKNQIIFLKE